MNTLKILPKAGCFLALLALVVFPSAALHAQISGPTGPAKIKFTGTLYAPDKAPENNGHTSRFEVNMDGEKKWIFLVDDAKNITGLETEISIVDDVFPPILYFRGEDEILKSFRNSALAGKKIIIKGYLYEASQLFDVTGIEVVPASDLLLSFSEGSS